MKFVAKVHIIYNSTKYFFESVVLKTNKEMEKFKSRKWLLSMFQGEVRLLPASKVQYKNIKTTTHQLKSMGLGIWTCSKKRMGDYTCITRLK